MILTQLRQMAVDVLDHAGDRLQARAIRDIDAGILAERETVAASVTLFQLSLGDYLIALADTIGGRPILVIPRLQRHLHHGRRGRRPRLPRHRRLPPPRLREALVRRGLLVLAAALGLLTVGGCGYDDYEDRSHNLVVDTVVVDGQVVECVVYDDTRYEQGGVSCDFEGAS
jgi:hypothetical protein